MALFKPGQGSSEYIIIFGAILIIGLIVISLMNFTPSTSSDISESESSLYWKAQAKPFIIQEAMLSQGAAWVCGNSQGQIILRIKNTDKFQLNLREIYIDGIPSHRFCAYNISSEEYLGQKNESFKAGQERLIWVPTNNYSAFCAKGKRSETVQLAFKYDAPYLADKMENGTMKLYINCGNDSSPNVLCNDTICSVGQSCCALKSPNYCYNTVGGTCNSCGGACPGGQTCLAGSCLIACGGGYCTPATEQCCAAAGNACIGSGLVCDACNGECSYESQACCYDTPPVCQENFQTCIDGTIVCYGSLCKPGAQECCEKTRSCVAKGACGWEANCPGGCESGKFCCKNVGVYMCLPYEEHCNDGCGGKCYYEKGSYCCEEKGPFPPMCLPPEISCTVCGACDPTETACCPKIFQCMPNGAPCGDGTTACFGELCSKSQRCDEERQMCVGK